MTCVPYGVLCGAWTRLLRRCIRLLSQAAFVKAGVPHVVAVKRSERIQDRAACIFAEAFYFALLRGGKSVQQAFDIGRSAVSSAVGLQAASAEAAKFVLLPHSGKHDQPLLPDVLGPKRGRSFADCSAPEPRSNLPAFFPLQFFGRHKDWHAQVANLSHRHKRLSLCLGGAGCGKSTLCMAASHHLLQRRAFSAAVYVNVSEVRSPAKSAEVSLARAVAAAVAEAGMLHQPSSVLSRLTAVRGRRSSDTRAEAYETVVDAVKLIFDCLQGTVPSLLILDDAEPMLRSPEGRKAVRKLIAHSLRRLPLLRVLLCCQAPLVIHGIASAELMLQPLRSADGTRLFCAVAPRPLDTSEVFDGCPARRALEMEVEQVAQQLRLSTEHLTVHSAGLSDGDVVNTRASWLLPDRAAVRRLEQLLQSDETFAILITALSGECRVTLSLSQQRRLSRSPVLRSAMGNPRALTILASCLAPAGAARPLRVLERHVLEHDVASSSSLAISSSATAATATFGVAGSGGALADAEEVQPPSPEVLEALRAVVELRKRMIREPSPPPTARAHHSRSPMWAPSAWLRQLDGLSAHQWPWFGRAQQIAALCVALLALLSGRMPANALRLQPPPPPPPQPSAMGVLSSLFTQVPPPDGGDQYQSTSHASAAESMHTLLTVVCATALLLLLSSAQGNRHAEAGATAAEATSPRQSRSELPIRRRASRGPEASPRRLSAPAAGGTDACAHGYVSASGSFLLRSPPGSPTVGSSAQPPLGGVVPRQPHELPPLQPLQALSLPCAPTTPADASSRFSHAEPLQSVPATTATTTSSSVLTLRQHSSSGTGSIASYLQPHNVPLAPLQPPPLQLPPATLLEQV